MIVALSAAAAVLVVAALAVVELMRPDRDRPPHPPQRDPHWGDWPPDQMAQ